MTNAQSYLLLRGAGVMLGLLLLAIVCVLLLLALKERCKAMLTAILGVTLAGIIFSIRYMGWAQKQDALHAREQRTAREDQKRMVR